MSLTDVRWPEFRVVDRGGWQGYWFSCLAMRHPNPGPHDLAEVCANGMSFDEAIQVLADAVAHWHAHHAPTSQQRPTPRHSKDPARGAGP